MLDVKSKESLAGVRRHPSQRKRQHQVEARFLFLNILALCSIYIISSPPLELLLISSSPHQWSLCTCTSGAGGMVVVVGALCIRVKPTDRNRK